MASLVTVWGAIGFSQAQAGSTDEAIRGSMPGAQQQQQDAQFQRQLKHKEESAKARGPIIIDTSTSPDTSTPSAPAPDVAAPSAPAPDVSAQGEQPAPAADTKDADAKNSDTKNSETY